MLKTEGAFDRSYRTMSLPERLGRYLLIRKIATGGMAEIFLAKLHGAEGFEKQVVIKKILPQWASDKDFVRMLIDEAKISVRLNHPNIVQVYELAREGEVYYIAMEYLEGVDLRHLMQKVKGEGKKIPLAVGLTIIIEVLDGLIYAHSKKDSSGNSLQIVHRDISPQNILVSFDGTVKLTDFGIAKAASQSHETMTGVLKGKLAYMSPEQANQETLDARSDLYSTAIVLYELLSGERLFHKGSDLDTLDRVRRGQVTFSPEAERTLPSPIRGILMKSLAKEKTDRYPDASSFREGILKFSRRIRKELRREEVGSFVSSLFAKEIALQAEEAARPLSRAAGLLQEETRAAAVKEVFVRQTPEGDTTPSKPERRRFPASLRITASVFALIGLGIILFFTTRMDEKTPPAAVVPAVPAAPSPPLPPAKTEKGFLNIQAVPWGTVKIDGSSRRWETPLRRHPLSPGLHSLKISQGTAGEEVSAKVKINSAEEITCVVDFRKGREVRCGK